MIHRPSTISGTLFALLALVTVIAATVSVSISLVKAGPMMWSIVGVAAIGTACAFLWTRHTWAVADAAAAGGESFIGHTLKTHER